MLSKYRLTRMESILLEQWKQGVTIFQRIAKRKNVLPWFILTGKCCGKTTLLASAELPILVHGKKDNTIVPTRTLRWSFFESIAFLELSSHFLLKSPTYERAWHHLTRWCKRQQPTGVIICISADDLLLHDDMMLHSDARKVRAQLEPLTYALNKHLPLYVLITGSDSIPGFSAWSAMLSMEQRQQALGYHWDEPPIMDSKDPTCLNGLFSSLRHGMELARLSMASSLTKHPQALEVFDFPEKISQLQPALHSYLSALIQPDSYFKQGMLGGVWFTAIENVNNATHNTPRRSLFIHDLFYSHLPALSSYHSRILEGIPYHSRRLRQLMMLICVILLGSSAMMSASLFDLKPKLLTSETLVKQLVNNEVSYQKYWRYLPFIPLFNIQHQWLEINLIQQMARDGIKRKYEIDDYKRMALNSEPDRKNSLILQLAQAIVIKQELQQGMPLVQARQFSDIPTELRIIGKDVALSKDIELAYERAILKHFPSESELPAMRQMLSELVQSDSQWEWLYTSGSDLQVIRASDFGFDTSFTDELSGIWTKEGYEDIVSRAELIIKALGQPLPSLNTQLKRLPELRQEHWLRWLFNLSHAGFETDRTRSWQSLLMDIDNELSPAMRLAEKMNNDLDNISSEQAQPWLNELRYLQQLKKQASKAISQGKIFLLDQYFRKQTSQFFKISDNTNGIAITPQSASLWLAWRSNLRQLIAVMLATPDNNQSLINEIFAPPIEAKGSSIRKLYSNLSQLRQNISSKKDSYSINLLWQLYQNDADLLLKHAINSAACDVQLRWKKDVLWPLNNNNKRSIPEEQPALALELIRDFMRNTAKGLFDIKQERMQAASFQGQSIPFTYDFIYLVNNVLRPSDILTTPLKVTSEYQDAFALLDKQQKILEVEKEALESQVINLRVSTQPATVPGRARLMPVGTRLTLACGEKTTTLDSMNFIEQARFQWSPSQCEHVELVIKFPNFNLHYDYLGDAAWTDFVRDFSQGEHHFYPNEFDDHQTQLQSLGITSILVRYQISNISPMQQLWKSWQKTDTKINQINVQRANLQEMQTRRQQPHLKYNLALLPTEAAQCNL